MGFLFLVLYPPSAASRLPSPHTHSHTHSLTHPPTHSLTHSLTLTHTYSLTHPLTHSLTHPLTHSLTLTHSHSLTLTHSHSLTHSLCVAGTHSLTLRGSVHCQGVGCTPWRPLGLRFFCVAGVAQCALPRGRMYALASLGSPLLLRDRRGTMCTAKGSDVRPGVPWVSAAFAWQAWHNVHCQGVGCTPWRPLGLRHFCVAGVAQCALPRGRMYALASLGSPPLLRARRGTMCTAKGSDVRPGIPWVSASFAWQAWHNVHCQGVGCTPWRPLGPFAWQAWDNVHCQGVGCTPWRPLGLRLFWVAGVA